MAKYPLIAAIFVSLLILAKPVHADTTIWSESFESTLNNWTIAGDNRCDIRLDSTRTSPDAGQNLFVYRPPTATDDCYIERQISTPLNEGRVSLWFFDNVDPANPINAVAAIKDANNQTMWLGIRSTVNTTNYSYWIQGEEFFTQAPRSLGWHRIEFVRQNSKTFAILDGESLDSLGNSTSFGPITSLRIASNWAANSAVRIDGAEAYSYTPSSQYSQLLNTFGLQEINTKPYGWQNAFDARIQPLNCCSDSYFILNNTNFATQDRFELVFNDAYQNILGLGRAHNVNKAYLDDFTDANFSSGHSSFPAEPGPEYNPNVDSPYDYNADVFRLKTPLMIIPETNTLIAYLHQNEVKSLRLSRDNDSTTIVMSKKSEYPEGSKGKLLIIKKNSLQELYSTYNTILRSEGFFFKKPHYNTFGFYYETYSQFGCTATYNDVLTTLNNYSAKGIRPSLFVVGSGYWDSDNLSGCGQQAYEQEPTTDSMRVSPDRWISQSQFNSLYSSLKNNNTYPMIGMRFNFYPETSHLNYILDKFGSNFTLDNTFLDNQLYFGTPPSNFIRMLNFNNSDAINRYVEVVRESYSPNIMGFKEDEMVYGDQKHFDPNRPTNPNNNNFKADYISRAYKSFSQKYNNDFVVIGQNDYFGVGTDGQNTQGYNAGFTNGNYDSKGLIDSMMTLVFSGYPHPVLQQHVYPCQPEKSPINALHVYQLSPFLPVTMKACHYWDGDPNYETTIDYFTKFRSRIHKYAYDKAQDWYQTGVPTLMKPLLFFPEWQADPHVISQYSYAPVDTNVHPRNQFMMGNALLIRPLLNWTTNVRVYLPQGKWLQFFKRSPVLNGGSYIQYQVDSPPAYDYPVFLKEGEILILGKSENPSNHQAYVFFDDMTQSSIYNYYQINNDPNVNNKTRLQAFNRNNQYYLKNLENNWEVVMQNDPYGKGFKIADISPLFGTTPPPSATPIPQNQILAVFNKIINSVLDFNFDGIVNIFDYNQWITFH